VSTVWAHDSKESSDLLPATQLQLGVRHAVSAGDGRIPRCSGPKGGWAGLSQPRPQMPMRSIRMLGAGATCLLATVVLILAIVLGLTLVLLPLGLALGYVSMRLYKLGVQLALPRATDVKRGVNKQVRGWRRGFRKKVRRGKKRLL